MNQQIQTLIDIVLWTIYSVVALRWAAYFFARGWFKGRESVCGFICEECANAAPCGECEDPECECHKDDEN